MPSTAIQHFPFQSPVFQTRSWSLTIPVYLFAPFHSNNTGPNGTINTSTYTSRLASRSSALASLWMYPTRSTE